MSKNKETNILVYTLGVVAALSFAATTRFKLLPLGGDDFTNNIFFVIYFILVMLLVYVLKLAFTEILDLIFKSKAESIEDNLEEKVEAIDENNIVETPAPTVDIETIRQEHIESTNKLKSEKLQIALDYVQREFALYLTDSNIKLLMLNIELYSEGVIDNPHPVDVKQLSNNDLYHFGWNIHNHFGTMNQVSTAKFIKGVFSHSLTNVSDINTIRKKFRNEDATLIKLRDNLSLGQQ